MDVILALGTLLTNLSKIIPTNLNIINLIILVLDVNELSILKKEICYIVSLAVLTRFIIIHFLYIFIVMSENNLSVSLAKLQSKVDY